MCLWTTDECLCSLSVQQLYHLYKLEHRRSDSRSWHVTSIWYLDTKLLGSVLKQLLARDQLLHESRASESIMQTI